jgi:hypothetical protein
MNSKERLLKALNREVPDRLPVTTHHVMPSFLEARRISSDQWRFQVEAFADEARKCSYETS